MQPDNVQQQSSLARDSLARFSASGAILLFGLLSNIATARWLGPYGKGTLAALQFIGDAILFRFCSLGLGEAAIILFGQKKTSLQSALSASLIPLGLSALIALMALLAIAIPAEWLGILPALLLQALATGASIFFTFLLDVLNARDRITFSSKCMMARAAAAALLTWLFLVAFDLQITGAVLAIAVATGIGLVGAVREIKRLGLRLRPSWTPSYFRSAAPIGFTIQMSYLAVAATQRLDQLFVYSLVGPSAGGRYAIALTVGQIVTFSSAALSMASFPRLARAEGDLCALVSQISRVSIATSVVGGVALLVATPVMLPLVFGRAYAPAVGPTQILILAGIFGGEQWVLARAAAAVGRTRVLFLSFGSSGIVMVLLDYLLIPRFGMIGAAVASLAAVIVGLIICLFDYRHTFPTHRWTDFFPKRSDYVLVAKSVLVFARLSRDALRRSTSSVPM